MPRTLVRWYGDAGGRVVLLGKPGPEIYFAAAAILNENGGGAGGGGGGRRGRKSSLPLLAIGDSLEHDMAGAAGAPCAEGVDAQFVGAGIHADELLVGGGGEVTTTSESKKQHLDRGLLELLLAKRPENQRPTLAMLWYQV
jgi:ribonucleotide monophosphatase NagD (HAD superfamily)